MNTQIKIQYETVTQEGDQTMHALIDIRQTAIGAASVQTVNARDLHEFLEVKSRFNDWITNRIADFDFIENQDFVSITENLVNPRGGRPAKEYALTLDMAKELSMVERNERGKQARQYFIECERRAKEAPPAIPQNLPDALRLAADLAEKNAKAEAALALAAPKVQGFDRIANAEGLLSLRETATTLKVPERQFIQWMQKHNWLYRRPGKGTLLGYSERIKAGLLEHKAVTIHNDRTGSDEVRESVRVTPLGLTELAKRAVQIRHQIQQTGVQL